jgi:hypothetical protein
MSPFYIGFMLGAAIAPCLLLVALGVWWLIVRGD